MSQIAPEKNGKDNFQATPAPEESVSAPDESPMSLMSGSSKGSSVKKPTAVKPTAAGPQSSGSSPSSGGSAEGEEEELDDFLDEEAEDVCEEMETGERVTRTPSMSSMEDVPVSSKDLFEEKFKAFDDEWSQLSTLKIVFNRAGLSAPQQQRFLHALRQETLKEGDYIVREGDMGDKFYIITLGEVVVTRRMPDGTEEPITHLYEGHFFGETSLVKNEPRNASVQVESSILHVMSISKEVFQPFLDNEPGFRRFIDELVAKKEETSKRRQQLMLQPMDADPEEQLQRNEVKISIVRRRGKTKSFKTIINNYVLLDKIGEGAFGKVYLTRSMSDGKLYAIKHVDRALLRKKRFSAKSDKETLREITVMKRLQHKNVVRLYEVIDDQDKDCFYMVQEYMELGPVLAGEEDNTEPLKPDVARKYMRDILMGLDYLHFQGVVHRDIKPGNLLVGEDGVCKIADFGTAILTINGNIKGDDIRGTPAFMAPELFTTLKSYSGFKADVYSLGVTLYNMVVGAPPFMAKNEIELVELVKSTEIRIPTDSLMDPHLRNLLLRMVAKNPEQRISLKDIMFHAWITDEGADPMPGMQYKRLKLVDGVAGLSTPGTQGAPSPFRNVGSPVPPPFRSLLSRDETDKNPESNSSGLGMRVRRVSISSSSDANSSALALSTSRPAIPRTTSFHNKPASSVEPLSPKSAALREQNQKEHLRALRARQYRLLQSHDNLPQAAQDRMLEQMRIPFHSERATAHMEEFVVDEAGHISSPTDGDRPMSSASTGEDRPLPSFGSTVKMSKTASVGSTTIPDITGRKGSTATLDSVPEGDFDELDSARSSVWSHNSSRERIAKQELFAGKRGTGSLRRLQDFVMVTSDVTTSENGEIKKKKVIFRANGKDGSLSITGGRHLPPRLRASMSASSSMSSASSQSSLSCPSVTSQMSGGDADNDFTNEATAIEEDSEVDSDVEDDIFTLDDMTGNVMDHKLGGVLDGLVLEEVKSSDIEISPLTSIEEKRWFDMRNSTLFNPAFGNPFGLLVGSSGLMGKRHTMEDEVAIIPDLNASLTLPFTMPDHAYFAVYDGHSGSEVSKMLTEKLHVYICDSPDFETDIVSSLVTAFVACDADIISTVPQVTSGSTAVVVLLRKGHDDTVDPHATLLDDETPRKEGEEHTMLYCANVGDSKAVLCRSGKAVELSYDHKPTRPDEKARIIEAGGSVVTGRLFGVLGVSRSFGDVRFKPSIESGEPMPLIAEPEVLHEQLCPEDEFVVLACDGVWDVMSPANVVCYVRRRLLEHGDPQQAAEELTQKALDLNSIDNVSAIVVRFPNMKKK